MSTAPNSLAVEPVNLLVRAFSAVRSALRWTAELLVEAAAIRDEANRRLTH